MTFLDYRHDLDTADNPTYRRRWAVWLHCGHFLTIDAYQRPDPDETFNGGAMACPVCGAWHQEVKAWLRYGLD